MRMNYNFLGKNKKDREMIKTTSDTIKRSFLIGIISQLNKVNFNKQAVISAAGRICRKASDINKLG